MFTKELLLADYWNYSVRNFPPLEVVEFGNQDFDLPCSEQYVWRSRGSKSNFENGLFFWVKCLQSQGCDFSTALVTAYVKSGLCGPIDFDRFSQIVAEYSGSLLTPLPDWLLCRRPYQCGLQMYAEWNDVAIIAQYEEEFVAFFWSTSA